jgi:F-type H+-transporting ATPase subunit delta
MKIDSHARQSAKKYLRACLRPDGSIDEKGMREIVQLLVTEKPRNYLAILQRLRKLIEIATDERSVRIESATPLPDEGASIIADLEKRFGPASRHSYEVNPDLLGGLRIHRGSTIWDGSLSNRLERLEQALGRKVAVKK